MMDMDTAENTQERIPIRCRKCRFHLFYHPEVLDSHGNGIHGGPNDSTEDQSPPACSTEVWYVPEEKMPDWMKTNVEWVKGKLLCPKCQARVGSYNFVSGMKCSCRSHVLPPIHIVKSKVDVLLPNVVSQVLIKD